METASARGDVFNIGNPASEVSIALLAELVQEAAGLSTEITFVPYTNVFGPNFEDTPRRVPSISHAQDILQWEPKVDLEEGLAKTASWWVENMDLLSRQR
jgi:nucleoside-diphosphate-sugar epimerase